MDVICAETVPDITRQLNTLRTKHGANSPKGHGASNLMEALDKLPEYERPTWATHECQTLPWMMSQQIARLAQHAEHHQG